MNDRIPPRAVRSRLAGMLRLGVVLLVIVLLVAITPAEDETGRHHVDVRVGEPGANRDYEATVTGVELTGGLVRYEGSPPVTSEAVFVVVTVTAGTTERSALYNAIELSTRDGRTYKPLDGFSLAQPKSTQPGFRTTGRLVFEVPPERIPGAKLIIEPDASTFRYYWTSIRVDLGLSEETPFAPNPVRLPEATQEVIR